MFARDSGGPDPPRHGVFLFGLGGPWTGGSVGGGGGGDLKPSTHQPRAVWVGLPLDPLSYEFAYLVSILLLLLSTITLYIVGFVLGFIVLANRFIDNML